MRDLRRVWPLAAFTLLAACGVRSEPVPFDIGESEGCYGNPNWTPPEARRPLPPPGSGIVHLSPIPGESGVSSTSSCLSGGGSTR